MSKAVLISLDSHTLSNIQIVKSFSEVTWDDISCVIFHSSSDSDIDVVKNLTKLKDSLSKFIYINHNINPLYFCIFTGLDADIYDSEDYLADEEVLNFLIDDYKNTGMTLKKSSEDLETLAKSIAAISSSDIDALQKLVSNEFWMKSLNTAVTNVQKEVTRASQVNIDVLEMLSESSKLITELEDGQTRVSIELEKFQKLVEDMERKTRPNTPFYFSEYTVPVSVPKVLYIKAYGDCRYLKSFISAYHHYLKMQKQYSSKVLFIMPKLKLYTQKYRNVATRIDQDSIGVIDIKSSNFFITYEPKKAVMDAFFNQQNVRLFIVVDLMFGDKLLNGNTIVTLNAVSGLSDIRMFKLKVSQCITPLTGIKDTIVIPHIPRYQGLNNEASRRAKYFEEASNEFNRLNTILSIGER